MQPDPTDTQYFAQRAREERDSAARTADSCARQTHLQLAQAYERRAAAPNPKTPRLRSGSG